MRSFPFPSTLGWLGLVLLMTALIAITFSLHRYLRFEWSDPAHKLEILWADDVETLRQAHKLPAGWNDIREISLIPATPEAKIWLKGIQVPLSPRPSGRYRMEILLLTWNESGELGAIVQYNLVDIKTTNMIWELGRTFILKTP